MWGVGSCEQVVIIITKGESSQERRSLEAATLLRSNGLKIITVYVGGAGTYGYTEQRSIVTNVGELAAIRIDRVDLLCPNKTDLLQRAADIPAPVTGPLAFFCLHSRWYLVRQLSQATVLEWCQTVSLTPGLLSCFLTSVLLSSVCFFLCPVTDISETAALIGVKFCMMVHIGPGQVFLTFGAVPQGIPQNRNLCCTLF